MQRVVIVAFDGVVPFDLSVPCDVFGRARLANGQMGYSVRVCGVTREVDAGPFRMKLASGLGALRDADTIVLPGMSDIDRPISQPLLRAVTAAARRGARVASICTGAFLLAATGLLDGRRATTHWLASSELARRHPNVSVDPDVLYVDEGQLLTSAGAAAGLDLCLHLVRRDYGAAVAADAARLSVMPLERSGGQSQFITHAEPAPHGASLELLLPWLEKHLAEPLSVALMARRAALSVRTLNRRFREQLGMAPLHWLLRARVRRAQSLLEITKHSVELVAEKVGFGSVSAFREQFQKIVGTSPQAYRRTFRGAVNSRMKSR